MRTAAASGPDRIVVLDSLTQCDGRVTPRDVVVAGSFAGALAFGFALERGVRGLVAHAAGVGRDRAGISGLPIADGPGRARGRGGDDIGATRRRLERVE